jgi:hypothetical protein
MDALTTTDISGMGKVYERKLPASNNAKMV